MPAILGKAFEETLTDVQKLYPPLTEEFYAQLKDGDLNKKYYSTPQRFKAALEKLEASVAYLKESHTKREAEPPAEVEGQLPHEAQIGRRMKLQRALREDYNRVKASMYSVFVPILEDAAGIQRHISSGGNTTNLIGDRILNEQMARNLLNGCMKGQGLPIPDGITF